jgi:hypothetical protein
MEPPQDSKQDNICGEFQRVEGCASSFIKDTMTVEAKKTLQSQVWFSSLASWSQW